MKEIKTKRGIAILVDDDDYEKLNNSIWYVREQKVKGLFYATASQTIESGKVAKIYMHRMILNCPPNMEVDHIDGDGLNNQKSNLRIVNHRHNMQNIKRNKTSQYPGVHWDKQKNKWRASIGLNGKTKYLGIYVNEEDAFRAYYDCILSIGETILDFPYPYEEEGEKEKIMENNIKYEERGFPPPMLKGKEYFSCMTLG